MLQKTTLQMYFIQTMFVWQRFQYVSYKINARDIVFLLYNVFNRFYIECTYLTLDYFLSSYLNCY